MEDQDSLRQPPDAAPTTSHRYASALGGCVRHQGPSAAEIPPPGQPRCTPAASGDRPVLIQTRGITQERPIAQNAKRSQSKTQQAIVG